MPEQHPTKDQAVDDSKLANWLSTPTRRGYPRGFWLTWVAGITLIISMLMITAARAPLSQVEVTAATSGLAVITYVLAYGHATAVERYETPDR